MMKKLVLSESDLVENIGVQKKRSKTMMIPQYLKSTR